jgi:NaMN:DMB phosphoribosyltransferase
LAMNMVEGAVRILGEMATFADAGVSEREGPNGETLLPLPTLR